MMVAEFELSFSYSQFIVWDSLMCTPGLAWTDAHSRQGFARREDVVGFGTLLEFGTARMRILAEPFVPSTSYQRVLGVPFRTNSGRVRIEAPDELDSGRLVAVQPAQYLLVCAQRANDEFNEDIVLYFERQERPIDVSTIIVRDESLAPPHPLLETAEIAG